MLPLVANVKRQPVPAKHLVIGLQADPDDVQAARTASPVLGAAMDLLIEQGGTAILSGTSGIAAVAGQIGARAASAEVGAQFTQRVQWWDRYSEGRQNRLALRKAAPAAEQAEAARLATANALRAGSSALTAVYEYAKPITAHGLVFMDSPNYEAVSATGQIASGATMICVATGVGSGFGSLPAPTLKLAASSVLYAQMEDDLDIDCGPATGGDVAIVKLGREVFERLLRHASGEKTKAEELALGENEFVPWPIGVLA